MAKTVTLEAEWTNDCQGKKDYDGHILSISTRYWPAGGGFILIHNDGGNIKWQEGIEGIRPSAKSTLLIRDKNDPDGIVLAERDFEGDSFEQVAVMVERWAQEQTDKAVKALILAFAL